jgi:hypothetical protein
MKGTTWICNRTAERVVILGVNDSELCYQDSVGKFVVIAKADFYKQFNTN